MDSHHYYQYQVFRHQLNKLQALKSSFQAWKCVSLGYALFATVLLSVKWHEVSTDLKLLQGIDQLLWHQQAANSSATLAVNRTGAALFGDDDDDHNDHEHGTIGEPASGAGGGAQQWPPAAAVLEELLEAPDANGSQPDRTNRSSAMLMSHMQVSLGRELNANQLLKREVEAFLGECPSGRARSKPTPSSSSILTVPRRSTPPICNGNPNNPDHIDAKPTNQPNKQTQPNLGAPSRH